MEFLIIGGGCYGSHHARLLKRGQQKGKLSFDRLLIVDRNPHCKARDEFAGDPTVQFVQSDWRTFLTAYLPTLPDQGIATQLVPAPFAPHLLFEFLMDQLKSEMPQVAPRREIFDFQLGLPYEHSDDKGNHFISDAAWLCPASCIEPAKCPAIKGPRTWELHQQVRDYVETTPLFTGVEILFCRHYAFGVGTIPVQEIIGALEDMRLKAMTGRPQHLVVATTSNCHGVLAVAGLN